jgi:hypothetical protein
MVRLAGVVGLVALLGGFLVGCGAKPEVGGLPEAGPSSAPEAPATAVAPTAAPVVAAPIRFEGDKLLSQRFAEVFGGWTRAAEGQGASLTLVAVSEVSNAATALLEERSGAGAECRLRWVWIEAMDREDGGGVGAVASRGFGGDCCGSEGCARTIEGQHLHLLRAIAAEDWSAVAAHVPDGESVAYSEVTPEEQEKATWSKAKIAAGEVRPPGCGPIDTLPSCDAAAADGSFSCRCDGGGYHISYSFGAAPAPGGLAPLVGIEAQMD